MLKERVITALVMVALLLAALFLLSSTVFSYVLLAVLAFSAWEWADLSSFSQQWQRIAYALVIVVITYFVADGLNLFVDSGSAAGFLSGFQSKDTLRDVLGVGVLWWAFALLWVLSYPGSAQVWGNRYIRLVMGALVLIPSLVAMFYLVAQRQGEWHFLYVLGIVIAADVGAYFFGRALGKKKLAPSVSPGKSWAGFFGGLACVAIYAVVAGQFITILKLEFVSFIIVSVIAALASVLGDLLESMVKRHRGIKDSSQLLPGHGGVMDRIDSLTAAAPVFVLLAILLGA